jgi:hypothetical protein
MTITSVRLYLASLSRVVISISLVPDLRSVCFSLLFFSSL